MTTINIFESYFLAGAVAEIVPKATFFKDRYFPTNPETDIFKAEKVLVEYQDVDRRLAPFVVPHSANHFGTRGQGETLSIRDGYEAHEFSPPFIAPSRLLTLDDLKKRGFGEALYIGSTPAERAVTLQMQDLIDLDRRITRREEWMAAQTMINNGCSAVSLVDDKETGEAWELYFYDVTKTNPSLYTVEEFWDDSLGNFMRDIEMMCEALEFRGITPKDLVIGSEVGHFLNGNEKIGKMLDVRRAELGFVKPEINVPGVVWYGNLKFGPFELDVFIVHETYEDDEGLKQEYFPRKSAMVTYPGCGRMMYAQITQIESDDQYHSFAAPRVPKFVVDVDKNIRKLRLASRPLATPNYKAPWMYAANVLR